jgi:hypothetical protein
MICAFASQSRRSAVHQFQVVQRADLDAQNLPSNRLNECPKVGGGEAHLNVRVWVVAASAVWRLMLGT